MKECTYNISEEIEESDSLINKRVGKEGLNLDIVEDIRKSASGGKELKSTKYNECSNINKNHLKVIWRKRM